MSQDLSCEYFNIRKMLHCTDSKKDKVDEYRNDWTGKGNMAFLNSKFYRIADLEKDGFIHPDGSLKFEFAVEKNYNSLLNVYQRLECELKDAKRANEVLSLKLALKDIESKKAKVQKDDFELALLGGGTADGGLPAMIEESATRMRRSYSVDEVQC